MRERSLHQTSMDRPTRGAGLACYRQLPTDGARDERGLARVRDVRIHAVFPFWVTKPPQRLTARGYSAQAHGGVQADD